MFQPDFPRLSKIWLKSQSAAGIVLLLAEVTNSLLGPGKIGYATIMKHYFSAFCLNI